MLIISTITGVATPYPVMVFIDDYLTPGVFPEGDMTWLITIFVLVQLIGAATTYMQIYLFQYLAFKVIQQLRIDAFDKIGRLGMRYFDKVPGGSVVSRITNDTEAIVEMFIGVLATFLMAFFMVISSFVMMFILDVQTRCPGASVHACDHIHTRGLQEILGELLFPRTPAAQ